MNRFKLSIFLIALVVYTPVTHGQQSVTISIDKIIMNHQISGRVYGLTRIGISEFKVVVYVKTDKWYIHPYKSGGDRKSFAIIDSKGSWMIGTIRRDYAASEIAALVVNRSIKAPSKTKNIHSIPNKAMTVKKLEGTDDFNKL